ncbi:hypothetical protein PR002_g4323 [Phytophthora rubi]|uniref:Uncharacterized protein n=1 Tax=Phytophthora rubi TaxID=129364 RepID=A0A6A3N8G3_9STRA|nr:hypothetical protein PR002_g4323 [Phytophthora rubi]
MSKRPSSTCISRQIPTKRPRFGPSRDQPNEPPPSPYPRLKGAHLPPKIRALPHILQQIDVFLMTDDEAAIEAARTGLAEWLDDLIPEVDDRTVTNAILEASTHGHIACVEVLTDEYEDRGITAYTSWETLQEAIEAAAANGHLEVLNHLLSTVCPGSDTLRKAELCGTTRGALGVAAEGGHLDVVKFMVEYAKVTDYPGHEMLGSECSALARAISGGHKVVVEYLLNLEGCSWDFRAAFVAAVDAGDKALADRIYVQTPEKDELFIMLSCRGNLDALKYLYETGHNDAKLIGQAFVKTTNWEGNDTLEFLLGTGRVSSEAFEKGFETAVESAWDRVNMVQFLLDKKRASAKAINKAFVVVQDSDILKMLLEREHIWDESIRAVFEQATGNLSEYDSRRGQSGVRIIKLLHVKDCIPSNMIGKAFVVAAEKGQSDLVALLRRDGRISARMVGAAFAGSATRKKSDMVMSLYDTTISPDAILAAFSNAAAQERLRNVKKLVKLFSDHDLVPQEFKHKAFVIAARLQYDTPLQILCESGPDYWPLTILKEALAASREDEVKNLIRKVICDQLYDPKCPWAR